MSVDWDSEASHLLLNPRMPEQEQERLQSFVVDLPSHVWLATSGTTGALKLVALSKRALLASAAAVNRHLQASSADVWCCVLPRFHVGGLGIDARAFLTGSRVVTDSWDAHRFAERTDVTLASLVPAQVSDLVRAQLRAPRAMRAIVVGGGSLSRESYDAARALGWPLLPSYGMTECASQVATATLQSAELVALDHVEIRTEEGRLAMRGESLLTGYGTDGGFVDPKIDGWFLTEDLGTLEGRILRIFGRRGDFVKIGGESVDLGRLDAILSSLGTPQAALLAVPDERLGFTIHLVVGLEEDGEGLAKRYNERVLPFERARQVHRVPEIPRTSLGKLNRMKLMAMIPNLVE